MNRERSAFGALLRELRLSASQTIEGLAEASGVSVRGIGDLERGRRAAPQRRTVAALADGLGLDETQRQRLLTAARAGRPAGYSPVGVRAFPRGVDEFVGRKWELDRLTALAAQEAHEAEARPSVVVVCGPPGAGKTTLAMYAARELADRYPDGQLVLDLRGTEDDAPGPAELVLRVLKALQVADRDLAQAGPSGHPALCRRLLAERRCLLVLDDARDEGQVRPLLPAAGAGMVMVTSRRILTGLDSVHRLLLWELEPPEAAELLTSLVGAERAAADPAALAEVAELCGHLPLALQVAGNWLATRTGWTVRRLADRLAAEDHRLDALAAGDLRVAAAFDLSYRQLTPAAARLFRRLSLVPGIDIGAACAAWLTGQPLFDAEDTLEELVETGLLCAPGNRYRLHDLLRLYARGRLEAEESARDAELTRAALYDRLLKTTVVAGRWFEPDHGCPPPTWQSTVDLSSTERAREWLQSEAANWLAALRAAAAAGEHAVVTEVAEALHWFSDQWIFWGHWSEVFGTAADSARALDDPVLTATHLNYHAWALLTCEDRPHDSLERSAEALAAALRAADTRQQAWAHLYRASALRRLGDHLPAADHMQRAAPLFEAADDLPGSLAARHGQAAVLLDSGDPEKALAAHHETQAFMDRTGDRLPSHIVDYSRGQLHSGMGACHTLLGRWTEAVDDLSTSVAIFRESGNSAMESRQLVHLGNALLSAGRPTQAREAFTRCVSLGLDADPQRVAEARGVLARLDVL